VDFRSILRDLLRVAELALADHHPIPTEGDVEALLAAALAVIDHSMPAELQAQDKRVIAAKDLLRLIRQTESH
jgi:hypothetical protein